MPEWKVAEWIQRITGNKKKLDKGREIQCTKALKITRGKEQNGYKPSPTVSHLRGLKRGQLSLAVFERRDRIFKGLVSELLSDLQLNHEVTRAKDGLCAPRDANTT